MFAMEDTGSGRRLPQLYGTRNFEAWRQRIAGEANMRLVWTILNGIEGRPNDDRLVDLATYLRREEIASGLLLCSISPAVMEEVGGWRWADTSTPYEVWKAVQDHFIKKKKKKKKNWSQKWVIMAKLEAFDLTIYSDVQKATQEAHHPLTEMHHHNITIEEVFTLKLLHSLQHKYPDFCACMSYQARELGVMPTPQKFLECYEDEAERMEFVEKSISALGRAAASASLKTKE